MTLKERTARFRHSLGEVFDDNLSTVRWHNIVDYVIIGMILLSTLEIFLTTFDLDPRVRRVLFWVDMGTLAFFTLEVTLRIWAAPETDPRYHGWKGRLRYVFTFHGFVDTMSTYPYLLQWGLPFPVGWVKLLRLSRVMRLFKLSRYSKSFKLLSDAIAEKRRELFLSLQFLLIVTFVLAIVLYFYEHDAQPDIYSNGGSTFAWAVSQYLGDPGHLGDNPPVTVVGEGLAFIVGLLGIAIVAVPAGIIGAGFSEALEKEGHRQKLLENAQKLANSFETKLDPPSRYQTVPPFRSLAHIQSRQGMTADDILETVNATPGFRLVNLAATIPMEKNPPDRLAVEHFAHNRPYGLLIDRGSRLTVVAPSSHIDDCTGGFAYYLAKIGGFNIISREFGSKAPYRSWYILKDGPEEAGEKEYFDDLRRLLSRSGAWSLTYLIASGANEPEYPTQVHIGTGNSKGDTSTGNLVTDKAAFDRFYADLSAALQDNLGIKTDHGLYHSTSNPDIYLRKTGLPDGANNIVMRVAWSEALWNPNRILLAREIAFAANRDLLGLEGNPDDSSLRQKHMGFE